MEQFLKQFLKYLGIFFIVITCLLGLLIFLVYGLLIDFDFDSDQQKITQLEKALSTITETRLTYYNTRKTPDCKTFVYKNGRYSKNKVDRCFDLPMGSYSDPEIKSNFLESFRPFDDQAGKDFKTLENLLNQSKIREVEVEFNSQGRIDQAVFYKELPFARISYHYNSKPNSPLPEDVPNERIHTRIDSHWYKRWVDWN